MGHRRSARPQAPGWLEARDAIEAHASSAKMIDQEHGANAE